MIYTFCFTLVLAVAQVIPRSQSNLSSDTEVPIGICQLEELCAEGKQMKEGPATYANYSILVTWQLEPRTYEATQARWGVPEG